MYGDDPEGPDYSKADTADFDLWGVVIGALCAFALLGAVAASMF